VDAPGKPCRRDAGQLSRCGMCTSVRSDICRKATSSSQVRMPGAPRFYDRRATRGPEVSHFAGLRLLVVQP